MKRAVTAPCLALAVAAAVACVTGAPAPDAGAPQNASASAVAPAPDQAPAAAPQRGPRPAEPPPPERTIEIRWVMEPDVAKPHDVPMSWIRAKFRAEDGSTVVVFERPDGAWVRRWARSMGSSGLTMVEEKVIDDRPPADAEPPQD